MDVFFYLFIYMYSMKTRYELAGMPLILSLQKSHLQECNDEGGVCVCMGGEGAKLVKRKQKG